MMVIEAQSNLPEFLFQCKGLRLVEKYLFFAVLIPLV
jgi:hypothetical protein